MAKCPRCAARKAKRHCPALAEEICPNCCAEERLKTIPCPKDCPHLGGELYQHRRRQERAMAAGKEFLARQEKSFPGEIAREFAFRLQADIYYFERESGALDDAAMAAALAAVDSFLSKIFVPPANPHPLTRFLVERLEDEGRYGLPGMTVPERRKVVAALAEQARRFAEKDGSRRFHDELASFFDALDFEADLDYSPLDPKSAGEETQPPRSPGGLILPPSY